MRKVYLYNPENDIALGAKGGNFTPPQQARMLARYGAPVLWWVGIEGDLVAVEAPENEQYARKVELWVRQVGSLCKGPVLVEKGADIYGYLNSSTGMCDYTCEPWGWSRYAAQLLRRRGFLQVEESKLEKDRLEQLRFLSHRRTASVINEVLRSEVDFESYGMPAPEGGVEARSFGEVCRAAKEFGEEVYIKTPWSSSGRGVYLVGSADLGRYEERIAGNIRRQGSVMVERAHRRVLDFAMLFRHEQGHTLFHGYSVFYTGNGTAYAGNILDSDEALLNEICRYIPAGLLALVRESLRAQLERLVGDLYSGYVGVDMMVAERSGGFYLVPCVEVNMRMTMGVVAHEAYRKMVGAGKLQSRAVMRMRALKNADAPLPGLIQLMVPENPCFEIGIYDM